MAPRLMRFPEMPARFIPVNATSIDSGIADATISPPRRFPSVSSSTAITSTPPSNRFHCDRADRALDQLGAVVEHLDGDAVGERGRERVDLLLSADDTTREFPPISIIPIPVTTSPRPSRVTAPCRIIGANTTVPSMPTVIGVPSAVVSTTTAAMSSRSRTARRRGRASARGPLRGSRRRRSRCSAPAP
jgi:hypothetical protein